MSKNKQSYEAVANFIWTLVKSKADRDSLENKGRNAVTFSFTFLFYSCCGGSIWCTFFFFFLANANLSSYQILPKVDGGHYLISLMSGVLIFFLASLRAVLGHCLVVSWKQKQPKTAAGRDSEGLGWWVWGALTENSDWAETAHPPVAIFSMMKAKTPGLCLCANHPNLFGGGCPSHYTLCLHHYTFFSHSLISKVFF